MRLTSEQRAARRLGLGTTDVIEILGLAPWEGASPMRVFCDKRGLTPETPETPEMAWGHTLEPVVLAWYEREIGPAVPVWRTVHHPQHEWLFATLDAYAAGTERRNIEIKVRGPFGFREGWDDGNPDGIPAHVRLQVNLGMAIREAPEADVVGSIGGKPPRVWRVSYDAGLTGGAIAESKEFWDKHVVAGEPPPLDHTSATRLYLDAKYPKEESEQVIRATPVVEQMGLDYIGHCLARNDAEKSRMLVQARLLDAIATAAGVIGVTKLSGTGVVLAESWKMTWKTQKGGKRVPRFSVRGVKLGLPEESDGNL